MDELFRLIAAVVLGAEIIGISLAFQAFYRRRVGSHQDQPAGDLMARYGLAAGQPAILYLWGDRCVQCVALQEPALDRIAQGQPIQLRKLRAAAEPELTRRFNILTVPSTVVIGADQRVRAVNVGFTDDQVLMEQLKPA